MADVVSAMPLFMAPAQLSGAELAGGHEGAVFTAASILEHPSHSAVDREVGALLDRLGRRWEVGALLWVRRKGSRPKPAIALINTHAPSLRCEPAG